MCYIICLVIRKNWDDKITTSKVDGLLSSFDDGELFVEEVFPRIFYLMTTRLKTQATIKTEALA